MENNFGRYGLPLNVKFCKKCTMNNQRPRSAVEFKTSSEQEKKTIHFNEDGICDACKYAQMKKNIDWKQREKELHELCDKYRRNDGRYDVIVPGSGGKDGVMASHILKYKYNMNPITITWPPALPTKIGRVNFQSWLDGGFANFSFNQNRKVHRLLTKLAFENLCHPFQPFILGQKNLAPKLSTLLDIPLVVFGENEAEYGNNIEDNEKPTRNTEYYSLEGRIEDLQISGVSAKELLEDYNMTVSDLEGYLPVDPHKLEKTGTAVHYLGYYLKWHPQETYYFAVENTNFKPNFHRTEGSYSKYASLDDKIDWLHYYTTYIKFGIGRTTYDSSQEIRNGDINREDGVALIKRFDGEFPEQYLNDCIEYMGMTKQRFLEIIEEFRTPHLWEKNNGIWQLKNPIWKETP